MACPTCDHTMQGLGDRWFWCPRCGTTLSGRDPGHTVSMPYGAEQVRIWLKQSSVTEKHARETLKNHFLKPSEREALNDDTH